jgi:peroxiredoxin
MSRRVLVLAVVSVCLALIVWSGFQRRFVRPTTLPAPRVSATTQSPDSQETDAVTSPLLGKPAPDFVLRDLADHRVHLDDYRGKAVLINFWATWCAPCQVEMPWFVDLQRKYQSQGFAVIGIDKDDPEDLPKVSGFARKMNLNYPVLYGNAKTYAAYGCCDYLPTSFYIDRTGTVRIATVGLGERDTVETYIRRLLQAEPPPADTHLTASAAATPPDRPK